MKHLKKTKSLFSKASGRRRAFTTSDLLERSLKVMGYTACLFLVLTGVAFAGLDDQLAKASVLVFGPVTKTILCVALLGGIFKAAVAGHIALAGAILAISATGGVLISMIQNGSLMGLLN